MRCLMMTLGMTVVLPASRGDSSPDYPIRPVRFVDVKINDEFWGPRIRTNADVTVWYDFEQCEKTGRIDNFAIAGGLKEGDFEGIYYNDSDVYKVIEGAAYTLAVAPNPRLDRYLDGLIAKIAAAQEDDGYLYTIRTIRGESTGSDVTGPTRWSNLRASHELYNVGHMYEAAVVHHLATGKRTLLDVALKSADLIDRVFGPKEGQRRDPPGHQEIEIGLVKLYRLTGEKRYLDLAKFFLDQRGRADGHQLYGRYGQDHKPVIEQDEPVGHAVRAGYMYSGMADIAALTKDQAYAAALERIWQDVVARKLYLTGGIGSSRHGEAFGEAYDLPNASAYNETCAAIANIFWNHRMFLLHGDAKYIDVLERTLYNGFLAGVSFSGDRFFYPNPLACDGRTKFNYGHLGRAPWFSCSCCPVNVVRFVASLPEYAYAVDDHSIYVNLYAAGTATVNVGNAQVRLTQETRYPWDGRIKIIVEPDNPAEFDIRLRIPGWTQGKPVPGDLYRYLGAAPADISPRVNGESVSLPLEKGFAPVSRRWKSGDTIELDLPMSVRRVVAHEQVEADAGRVALGRGPIVYCFEAVDNDGSVGDIVIDDQAALRESFEPGLLRGVVAVRAAARRIVRSEDGRPQAEPCQAMAVPYYAWAHREVGAMAVWMPRDAEHAHLPPLPTIASRSTVSASHVCSSDTATALNDQIEPASSGDDTIPRFTWWDHRSTAEWVQYTFEQAAEVARVEVYWFDDTGRGQCRVPASWRVLYRHQDQWKPVSSPSAFGVARDMFNVVTFDPVVTDALRIEVQLRPGSSAGILEWRVN